MITALLFIAISFFIGSIPFGYLVGHHLFKKDITKLGSGNIGATNTFRILGRPAGTLVFILDVCKGAVPLLLFIWAYPGLHNVTFSFYKIAVGMAAPLGHMYSPFLNFKGGKGVSTGLGVILVLSFKVAIILVVVQFAVLFVSRYVSLASITSVTLYPVLVFFLIKGDYPLLIFAFFVAALVVFKHRENIKRIINKTEPRIWA
ncbi:MAG: glycerol-3-phosphate 1-O-acyltransferase [Actinobacteria bacterium]|nr:MAG: glycerol-3-phosphate 1-O-acyltransferase [Actinomycetota bacterium]